MNPYQAVRQFEEAVAEYAGSKYAVAVDNCTNALFLSCKYLDVSEVEIPSRTYVSVPCAIINAGGKVKFDPNDWENFYQLRPYPIIDAAGYFCRDMYVKDTFFCISFSTTKVINIGKGGMILTDDLDAAEWFRKARYMGRSEVPLLEDNFEMTGWNMYMTPEQASRGLMLMLHVSDQNRSRKGVYPDLSKYKVFTTS